MNQIYIVIEGGCLRYVSTDSQEVIKNVQVTVIDLDIQGDSQSSPEEIAKANSLIRIW